MAIIKIVEIENFQSHVYTKLEMCSSLNVIVGPSDQGKSAIIRALRWLFYNEPRGTDFFRVGSTNCRVSVQLNTGEVITRERANNRNRYLYRNPKGEESIYEGFGNSVPWEISKIIQMPKIVLDKDTEATLNIGNQLESPFLLNESGTLRAKMIGRLTGVHIIDAAIRETAKDLLNQQQEEKRLTIELEEIIQELDNYSYLDGLLDNIHQQERLLEKITLLSNQMRLLEEVGDKWKEIYLEEKKAKEFLAILPSIEQVESLLNQSEMLIQRKLHLDRLNHSWKSVEKELEQAQHFLDHTRGLTKGEESLVEAQSNLTRLKGLLQLQAKIKSWKKEYLQSKEIWKSLKQSSECDKLIQPIEKKIEDLTRLELLARSLEEIGIESSRSEKELVTLEGKLKNGLQKYQLKLQESGKCPFCSCPLDEKTVKKIVDNYSREGGI